MNGTPFPAVNLRTPEGLVAFMEHLLRDTWALENSINRSRALGYLAQVQKGLLDTSELERRLAALESILKIKEENNEKDKSS